MAGHLTNERQIFNISFMLKICYLMLLFFRVTSMDNCKVLDNEDDGMKENKSGKEEDDLFTTWSSLSDDTSSISTTSLDSGTKNNMLVQIMNMEMIATE